MGIEMERPLGYANSGDWPTLFRDTGLYCNLAQYPECCNLTLQNNTLLSQRRLQFTLTSLANQM